MVKSRSMADGKPRVSLARALSKIGFCSRKEAEKLIRAGRVQVDGQTLSDPDCWTRLGKSRIAVDGHQVRAGAKVYLALNKPRGFVTTRMDEAGRTTVYSCLQSLDLPFLIPVGRLDKASEGLLLMTNDTRWANRILSPESGVRKTYYVQIDRHPDEVLLARLRQGAWFGEDFLSTESVHVLRLGERNAWLEICLTQGRNRQIRRVLEATGCYVLRLVRVAVGQLQLGSLGKGEARLLTPEEVVGLQFNRSGDEKKSDFAGQTTCEGASMPASVLKKPTRIQARIRAVRP